MSFCLEFFKESHIYINEVNLKSYGSMTWMNYNEMTLPGPPSRGMCRKVSFPRTKQNGVSVF